MSKQPLLSLSSTLDLPLDAVTQKLAFLGISGSGKTYASGKFAEELLRSRMQVVVIDTVGNWWGLRLSSDGKRVAFQIPILGGDHGDIELDPSHGELVAETVSSTNSPMIVDVSDFTNAETRRFVTEFATKLLAAKKRRPSPVMIIWEECQEIVPQRVFGEDAKMVGAVQKLIKKGRNYGVGTTLISQRAAAVNKEALNQCHTLFGFRLVGKQDRKAVEDWITDHDTESPTLAMSKLETGTCLLWSPQWLKKHELVAIGKKTTFDASATPEVVRLGGGIKLPPVDLEAFKAKMGAAIEQAKANSPEALKKRIAELEGNIAAHAGPIDLQATVADLEHRNRQLEEQIRAMESQIRSQQAEVGGHARAWRLAHVQIDTAIAALRDVQSSTPRPDPVEPKTFFLNEQHELPPRPSPPPPEPRMHRRMGSYGVEVVPEGSGSASMSVMERRLLTVLAQRGGTLPKHKILMFASYASSGPVSKAFAELVARGFATNEGRGELAITVAGRNALGRYEPLPVGSKLRQSIMNGTRLSTMEKKLLAYVCTVFPKAVAKGDVLKHTGYASSGPVSKAWAKLTALEYIKRTGSSEVRASEDLFDNL